jgi:hypothetical protein
MSPIVSCLFAHVQRALPAMAWLVASAPAQTVVSDASDAFAAATAAATAAVTTTVNSGDVTTYADYATTYATLYRPFGRRRLLVVQLLATLVEMCELSTSTVTAAAAAAVAKGSGNTASVESPTTPLEAALAASGVFKAATRAFVAYEVGDACNTTALVKRLLRRFCCCCYVHTNLRIITVTLWTTQHHTMLHSAFTAAVLAVASRHGSWQGAAAAAAVAEKAAAAAAMEKSKKKKGTKEKVKNEVKEEEEEHAAPVGCASHMFFLLFTSLISAAPFRPHAHLNYTMTIHFLVCLFRNCRRCCAVFY